MTELPDAASTEPEQAEIPADARDPAVPIGTPPGGGSWTWDIDAQAWRLRDDPAAAE